MSRHTLPSGGWVDLVDVNDLRASHSRRIEKHWLRMSALRDAALAEGRQAVDPDVYADHAVGLPNLITAIAVQGWHLPYNEHARLPRDNQPRPASPAEPDGYDGWLDDIQTADHDAIKKVMEPIRARLLGLDPTEDNPNQAAADPSEPVVLPGTTQVDPASPTQPADGSEPVSRETAPTSPQPPTPSTTAGTEPSVTGGGSTATA